MHFVQFLAFRKIELINPSLVESPVAGKTVANAGDVREANNAARADNKNSVLMRIKSGGSSRFVAVPLAKG